MCIYVYICISIYLYEERMHMLHIWRMCNVFADTSGWQRDDQFKVQWPTINRFRKVTCIKCQRCPPSLNKNQKQKEKDDSKTRDKTKKNKKKRETKKENPIEIVLENWSELVDESRMNE